MTAPRRFPRLQGSRDPYRLRPLTAVRAMRRLIADKEDTQQVFEIMRALNGRSTLNGYHRLLRTREGARQAYRRLELAELLDDRAYVEAFAPGTLGHAYAEFTRREGLSSQGLAEESRKGLKPEEIVVEHPVAWFGRRTRDIHDLWHVLTGYGRDALGEACLVAFSYAQTGGLGWAFIAASAAFQYWRHDRRQPYVQAIWEGYRNGRAAEWLLGQDYETLLSQPLFAARAQLNIREPRVYLSIPEPARDRQLQTRAEPQAGAAETPQAQPA